MDPGPQVQRVAYNYEVRRLILRHNLQIIDTPEVINAGLASKLGTASFVHRNRRSIDFLRRCSCIVIKS